jgi:pyridinium-3,5-biscarboxylic acid mononucleotide synthase
VSESQAPPWLHFDWARAERTGVPEAVLAGGKSVAQLAEIVTQAQSRQAPLLLTRLETEPAAALVAKLGALAGRLDYDPVSRTALTGRQALRAELDGTVAVVAAGSSDLPIAQEAVRSLSYLGAANVECLVDVGVAGLWRLLERVERISERRVVIAVAGMEGALFSVVAGLVKGLVVAVPTSVGYGVSAGGQAALSSALASCAPGVVTVNIDNGFGAACAASKMLQGSG